MPVGHQHAVAEQQPREHRPADEPWPGGGERQAASPHAATAAISASAETAMKTAAGVSTRNGAARRASSSAPSARSVDQHRGRGRRRQHGDHEPGGQVAAQPEPHQADEEQQRRRAGGRRRGSASCRRRRRGSGRRRSRAGRATSSTARAVRRYSYGLPSDRDTRGAVDAAPATSSHASAPAYDASSSRRQGSRSARSAAYRQPSEARPATAGIVPGPNSFGRQRPCSGGTSRGEAFAGRGRRRPSPASCGLRTPHEQHDHGEQRRPRQRGPRPWSTWCRP